MRENHDAVEAKYLRHTAHAFVENDDPIVEFGVGWASQTALFRSVGGEL